MLNNLQVFVSVAEHGSLTTAAATLKMTLATVSRRISELESELGCELFHRSNKGLKLTPIGEQYFRECASYIHELTERLENLDRSLNSLEGTLKILAPSNLGNGPLDDLWKAFVAEYPQISLSIQLVDPSEDVSTFQADIGIQSGFQKKSALVQDLIGTITPVLVASTLLRGNLPTKVDQLDKFPSIAASLFHEWKLTSVTGAEISVVKNHAHICNDMNVTLNLVRAGAGIGLLPTSMVERDLNEGSLVRVLPDWSGIPRPIYVVWPVQRTLSIRANSFRTKLIEFLREKSWFTPA